jgi:hypothetical protein
MNTLVELEKKQEDGAVRLCCGEETPKTDRKWHILHTMLIHKGGSRDED